MRQWRWDEVHDLCILHGSLVLYVMTYRADVASEYGKVANAFPDYRNHPDCCARP